MKTKVYIFEYLLILIGSILYGLGTVLFIFPSKIFIGGVSDIAAIINYRYAVPRGDVFIVFGIALTLLSFYFFNSRTALKTLVGAILTGTAVAGFGWLFAEQRPLIENRYISALVGVLILAIACGILFYVDSSSDGTDIVALILKKYTRIRIGRALIITNVLIVIFGSTYKAGPGMYLASILGLFIKALAIDFVIFLIHKFLKKDLEKDSIYDIIKF